MTENRLGKLVSNRYVEDQSLKRLRKSHRLTFCEHTQPESFHHCEDDDPQVPVRLRGLLAIKDLAWLSDDGRDILTQELRKRDYNIRRRRRGASAKESNLTLANIFDSKGKLHNKRTYIKVIIQATKEGPAVYMNCKCTVYRGSAASY